ncbi:prolactin-like isoform X2 [Corythoichthys intestinalis]|uniref:prolactin-like isoform X2 n=1 Tax=Corythoichthys intestinalis TaxID=161448 RepID=UPI0025A5D6AA|nr:prolactin-like isoform X2 [Corythoichthys intestinalis]XP_061812500.1 prolactin-like [Nerophis lumbriciformis]
MKRVSFLVVMLAQLLLSVASAPICAYGQTGCPLPTLADLFDRVMQQSSRMHGISSDLQSQFEHYLFPSKNMLGKWKCHTHDILTPGNKQNAQNIDREQLTEVILRLLGAWGDPLSQLHQSMRQDHNKNHGRDFSHSSSNKALEMSDVMQELRDGVLKMAEKMKLQGAFSNAVAVVQPEEARHSSAFAFYKRGTLSLLDHNDLLYCLRRDSDKVKNYLRILQCSTLPGLEC